MSKFLVIFAVLGLLGLSSCASDKFKGSASTAIHSRYIGALGHQLSEDPVVQGMVTGSHGPWEAKVVGFEGVSRKDTTADEVDLWLAYKGSGWSAGVAYFAFDPVLDQDGDVVMPYLEASADIWRGEGQSLDGALRSKTESGSSQSTITASVRRSACDTDGSLLPVCALQTR
ncbi:MAG: hypothetical protein COU11_04485 [Candidatus Harrisonbacteria bacterium CG10_big_fil_rev_8_21_14_0_10_49_15]|uniref:Lipoprotein n=1 Tax=Candidatus Harrisonbacteria bacterium CG10_big_fil_rev_8_21_14_0_10_49_15 TaxID=1974587 RepID=A0A2H0UK09_9BACT|nr:MAG: hypothetical protein COU11_04485 [Candidatus Harrisonbacteria bacterium CG10_big_fil_rev_8_21_14_0_10_49_15]